jgi:hypothetical protein
LGFARRDSSAWISRSHLRLQALQAFQGQEKLDESEWMIFENAHKAAISQGAYGNVLRIRGIVPRHQADGAKLTP